MSKLRGYLSSLRENFKLTRKVHRWVGLEMLVIFVGVAALIAVPVGLIFNWLTGLLVGLPVGLLAMTYWFSRRAMNAAYSQIEGQTGAAVAVIQQMRGNWSISPAVAVTKNSDIVSRVVGRPGVILVGEGPAQRITPPSTRRTSSPTTRSTRTSSTRSAASSRSPRRASRSLT